MQEVWSSVVTMFSTMHFHYTVQLFSALLPMGLTVILHAQGVGIVGRCFRRFAPKRVGG